MAPKFSLLLILFLTFPVIAEQPVTPRVVGPSYNEPYRFEPSIAFGASTVLMAWHDASFVVLRLFRKDGTPLHDVQLRIAAGIRPRVVWNGSEYLVAYVTAQPRIGIARVAEDGTIGSLTTIDAPISTAQISAFAINGDRGLLAVSGEIFVVDRDGNVVAAKPVQGIVSLTPFGDGFAAAVERNGTLTAVMLTREGDIAATIPIAESTSTAAIAGHDDQLAVVWAGAGGLFASTIEDGHVVSQVPFAGVTFVNAVSIAWDGGIWQAAWERGPANDPHVCAGMFLGDSSPLTVCASENGREPIAASDGLTVAMSWVMGTAPYNYREFAVAVFAPSGRIPDFERARVVSEAAPDQRFLAAAEGANGIRILWNEPQSDRPRVHLGGLTANGEPRPDRVTPITRAEDAQLVNGNTTTLAVWTSGPFANIYASRIDADGNLLDLPILLGLGRNLRAAFDGREWLVVFESSSISDTAHTQIVAATVDENGDATFGAPIDSKPFVRQHDPRIAWTGSAFLVTWYEQTASARLVDTHGNVISRTVDLSDRGAESVACGPMSCITTWADKAGFLTASLSELGPVVNVPAGGVARPFAGNAFAIDSFTPSGVIETLIDASGRPFDVRRLTGVPVTGVVLPSTIVYSRDTRPDELYGGAVRLFTQRPVEPRARAARH
jgi:hypothetical protein